MEEISKSILDELKRDEGFRAEPYRCSQGVLTIGYGTTLPLSAKESELLTLIPNTAFITEGDAELLLRHRLKQKIKRLHKALRWLDDAPIEVKQVLYNMAYQMGVGGVLSFKNTLKLIKNGKYKKASKNMLKSLWARQTPNRAKRLAKKMREVAK